MSNSLRPKHLVAALFASWALAWGALFVSTARADDIDPRAAERGAAESRSATFQAVTGAQQEDVPGGPLLIAAYGAVLALVLGYVLYLGRLTSGASRDLDRLEKSLEAGRRAGESRTGESRAGEPREGA